MLRKYADFVSKHKYLTIPTQAIDIMMSNSWEKHSIPSQDSLISSTMYPECFALPVYRSQDYLSHGTYPIFVQSNSQITHQIGDIYRVAFCGTLI